MVQPAGPAGKRHIFLTLSNCVKDDGAVQQIELVFSESDAYRLGEVLISASVGIVRDCVLSPEESV